MPSKRKDSKDRILRNGEVQRRDGMYMFRYTDPDGKRKGRDSIEKSFLECTSFSSVKHLLKIRTFISIIKYL